MYCNLSKISKYHRTWNFWQKNYKALSENSEVKYLINKIVKTDIILTSLILRNFGRCDESIFLFSLTNLNIKNE